MMINWQQCRNYMLAHSAKTRHPAYIHRRVSKKDVQPYLEGCLRKTMDALVKAQPGTGKTIMAP
jgi:hypothetical protein